MAWVCAYGACYACGQLFTFNPHRVPSIRIEGERQPICRGCVNLANRERARKGLELIVPLSGAYEPEDEGDGWLHETDDGGWAIVDRD